MATNNSVKSQLQNRTNTKPQEQITPEQTIESYMRKMAPRFGEVLPKHMNIERMTRIASTLIRTNPKLLECNVGSLMGAVMQASQLGLEPGLIGHCYIIPYGKEATFIIGYKGMIDLARRSGQIESIYAHCVYEADTFEYELGLHPKLVHKPATNRRGALKYVYAVAHFKDGGYQFEVMDLEEIDKRRKRSKAANNGPWVTDFEEMAKKTVIRHMWKYLPISIEIQHQVTQDEVIRKDVTSEPISVYEDGVIDVPHVQAELVEETATEPKQDDQPKKQASLEDVYNEIP